MKARGFAPLRRIVGAGFSLIEVLVAMLILALIAGGMFSIFVSGTGFVTRAGHKTEAINLARGRMEELKSRGYAGIPLGSHVDPPVYIGGIPATRTWTVTSAPDGKRIEVRVQWTVAGISSTERIVTLVANPG